MKGFDVMSIKNMKLVRRRANHIGVIEYKNDSEGNWKTYEFSNNKWEKVIDTDFDFGDEIGNTWEEYFYIMLAISDEWQTVSGDIGLDNDDDDDYK